MGEGNKPWQVGRKSFVENNAAVAEIRRKSFLSKPENKSRDRKYAEFKVKFSNCPQTSDNAADRDGPRCLIGRKE